MLAYLPSFLLSLALLAIAAYGVKFREPEPVAAPGEFVEVSLEDAPPGAAGQAADAKVVPPEETPPAPPEPPADPPLPPPPLPATPLETPSLPAPDPLDALPREETADPSVDMVNPLVENLPDYEPPPPPKPAPVKPKPAPVAKPAPSPAPVPRPATPAGGTGQPTPATGSGKAGSSGSGGKTSGASYRYAPRPSYPAAEKNAGVQGTVLLRVSLDSSGRPTAVAIVRSSGSPGLDQAAAQSVASRWKFHPALKDGVPVPSTVNVPIEFVLR
jgi:protein TonB